ncbi:MAG TPA: DUF3500 domain-containing protein [Cyclobacteriaceae bacterium]|nr:DUF3500 domain-containing protein [Cyclobacteriaceae bacterium]
MKLLLILMLFAADDQFVAPAKKFLSSIDASAKSKLMFGYNDNERYNWNFVPTSRRGIPIGELSDAQKKSLEELLTVFLSEQGYRKATGVMSLEGVLREVEGRGTNDNYRDPKKYFVSFFGEPEMKSLWGWRLEGHHLSLNFTYFNGVVEASTPSFMGANPAVVPSGSRKGEELLKDETALAFAFLKTLSEDQLKIAVFSSNALPEIVTGNAREAKLLDPKGISYKELNADQQKAFIKLLNVFVKNYELGFSSKLWDKIQKAGVDNLTFAWAGATTPGSGTYYRIQGPTLQIEYDNTQTRANHVHTAVRDLTNDFAGDVLKQHYQKEH